MSLALPEALLFVGIDWAAAEHAVCVRDAAGKIVSPLMIAHSAGGIAVLMRRLARPGGPADIPIAIERPKGRLVDLLLEAEHPIAPVKPNAIKTRREGRVLSDADALVEMRVAASNQLCALLDAHWTSAKATFADVESPISLAFSSRCPTPAGAAHVGEKRTAAFCVKHGYSG